MRSGVEREFLSKVSHELKTPLVSISGFVKFLLSEDPGPLNENQKEFLQIIDRNVQLLSYHIGELLDVEALESGHFQLNPKRHFLVEILKECRDTFLLTAKQKGISFEFDVREDLPVWGDRVRLGQIFTNLLSNAFKYTSTGFVKIKAGAKGKNVEVRIQDSGVGLSKEEQKHLFEKFYRAPSTRDLSVEGTGLGLAIVRGLLEAHHGQVTVESEPGKGTTFHVVLPRSLSEK